MDKLTKKWDEKFAKQSCELINACEVLQQNIHLLPSSGKALDFACGLGGNALCLSMQNLETYAWDISRVALDKLDQHSLAKGLKIKTEVRDVEKFPPTPASFDVIVVANFLHRPIFHSLLVALRPQGLLFYQTFIEDKINQIGPTNPRFLLKKNELLTLCDGQEILVYREEGLQGNTELGWRNQAMIVAKKSNC